MVIRVPSKTSIPSTSPALFDAKALEPFGPAVHPPTCPSVQRTLPTPARCWVGKAKLFSEDINVIKEPVLGTAPSSPVVLSPALLPWDCRGEVGATHDPCGTHPPWPGACLPPPSCQKTQLPICVATTRGT